MVLPKPAGLSVCSAGTGASRRLARARLAGAALARPAEPAQRLETAQQLDQDADRDGDAEGQQEARPGLVLESPAAQAPDEKRVQGPDEPGARGREYERAPLIPDDAAGQGHRGATARNEPADDDEPGAVPVEGVLRPGAPALALRPREHSPFGGRAEALPDQVAQVVPPERAVGRERDEQRDPRVGTAGRGH